MTRSWSGVFAGVCGTVVVVALGFLTVVVVFGLTVVGGVVAPPAGVESLVSIVCNSSTPMMTASPINNAPFAIAELAFAASAREFPPSEGLISSFCPVRQRDVLIGRDQPCAPRPDS